MQEGAESNDGRERDMLQFFSIGAGGFRLMRKHITKERLIALAGFESTDELVIVDGEGEEVEAGIGGLAAHLTPGQRYTLATETDLDDGSAFQRDPFRLNHEEMLAQRSLLRGRLIKMQEARRALVAELYVPLHPEIYAFETSYLMPEVKELVERWEMADAVTRSALVAGLTMEKIADSGVFALPVLQESFCDKMVAELAHFEDAGLPLVRPNSMNNRGFLLDEIGFTPMLATLRDYLVQPLAAALLPHGLKRHVAAESDHSGHGHSHGAPKEIREAENAGGQGSEKESETLTLTSHHGFVVQYRMGEDTDLGFHYDQADVTLNVCLGKDGFEGGELYFKGVLDSPSADTEDLRVGHVKGRGILHVGRHRHGALPITAGERLNLILWCNLPQENACGCC